MSSFVESLESRTLLSSAPSVAVLAAEARVINADLTALGKVDKANFKIITADLKAGDELKSSKALIKALAVEGTADFAVTSRGIKKTGSLIKTDVARLVAAAAKLRKHPTNDTDIAKVTAAANTLSTDAANRLTLANNDIAAERSTNSANLMALAAANAGNTQLMTDATNTLGPNATAARDALTTALSIALTTDVTAIIAAFPT